MKNNTLVSGSEYSIRDLLNGNYKIVIPDLQRDYCWGLETYNNKYGKQGELVTQFLEAIINSYNKAIHTILTSASILIIVTLIVGNFASAIAAKICKTISQGTLCSAILILVLLPAVLASCDRIIIKKKKN